MTGISELHSCYLFGDIEAKVLETDVYYSDRSCLYDVHIKKNGNKWTTSREHTSVESFQSLLEGMAIEHLSKQELDKISNKERGWINAFKINTEEVKPSEEIQ